VRTAVVRQLRSVNFRSSLFGVLWCASALHAQDRPIEIRDASRTCAACSIALTRIATLAPPDTAAYVAGNSHVAVDSRGRFLVSSAEGGHVHRFAADGRYEGQIGRPGQGPGEFARITALVVGPGDSLFVFQYGRFAVFAPNGAFVRTAPTLGAVEAAVVRPDGFLLAKMSTPTAERGGMPLHRIGPNGAIHSFGLAGENKYSASCPQCSGRGLHPSARGDRVWVTARNRYALESWSVDGTLMTTYRIADSRWFRDWDREGDWIDGSARRPSTILQVAETATGNIVVVGAHGSANATLLPPREGSGVMVRGGFAKAETRGALQDYVFDMMLQNVVAVIEHIDLSRREVISSTRLPGELRLLNAATAWRTVRRPDDSFGLEILAVKIINPPR